MTEQEFEQQLSRIKLKEPSDTFLENGLSRIQDSAKSRNFFHRHLQLVMASALVTSVAINLLQLANSQQENASGIEIAQCDTPPAAMSPTQSQNFEIVVDERTLTPVGMC